MASISFSTFRDYINLEDGMLLGSPQYIIMIEPHPLEVLMPSSNVFKAD